MTDVPETEIFSLGHCRIDSPIIARLHAWVARSWKSPPDANGFAGLAQLYSDNPDFRARYEGKAVGLTEYLAEAMRAYARTHL